MANTRTIVGLNCSTNQRPGAKRADPTLDARPNQPWGAALNPKAGRETNVSLLAFRGVELHQRQGAGC